MFLIEITLFTVLSRTGVKVSEIAHHIPLHVYPCMYVAK